MSTMDPIKSLDSISEDVYSTLDDLGLQQHLLGYNYIAYAVDFLTKRLTDGVFITVELYPEIAEVFGSSKSRVERAIRHAIEVLFNKADPEVLNDYFGNSVSSYEGKMSNAHFLYAVARRIRRDRRK